MNIPQKYVGQNEKLQHMLNILQNVGNQMAPRS
jgi:hypothetical protein